MDSSYKVGQWLVEPSLNTISRNGTTVQLEPKVMSVLVCLVEHAGDPVSKQQLLQSVWPDTFVSEGVLTRSISELRKVFEDEAKEPRVIQTIAKRGYRLVAPVIRINGAVHLTPGDGALSATSPSESVSFRSGRRISLLFALSVVVLLLAAWKVPVLRRWVSGKTGSPAIQSLAVLPLKNLSSDQDQKYFAYGLTDALITELSQIRSLRVISHTSVDKYKGETGLSLPEIARELNVDAVIEGSVQRSSDRTRISVQLIYAPVERHLWARSYDRRASDILMIEQEIARGVADEIAVQLTPPERTHLAEAPSADPIAVEAYLKGKYHADQAGEWGPNGALVMAEQQTKALEYYRQALDRDPSYIPAYIATARSWLGWLPTTPEKISNARAALKKALVLDPQSAQAHLLVGRIAMYQNFDWSAAEKEFKLALELDPRLSEAHESYASYLEAQGRLEEASIEWKYVWAVDPDNLGRSDEFLDRRRYDQVIELNMNRLEREAYFMAPHWALGVAYERTGKQEEAVQEWEKALDGLGYKAGAETMRKSWSTGGYKAAVGAFARFAEERALSKTDYVYPCLVAYLYEVSDNKNRAFAWLQKAYDERDTSGGSLSLTTLNVDPEWDPIRSDPRFGDLVRKMGLPAIEQ